MKTLMDETIELHRTNVQLMDTLAVIAARFLEISAKYHLQIEGLDSLAFLFGKASKMLEEIGTPYYRNPIVAESRRDESEQNREGGVCNFLGTTCYSAANALTKSTQHICGPYGPHGLSQRGQNCC